MIKAKRTVQPVPKSRLTLKKLYYVSDGIRSESFVLLSETLDRDFHSQHITTDRNWEKKASPSTKIIMRFHLPVKN